MRRRDSKVDVVIDLLREKRREEHHQMRRNEGKRRDQKGAARAHLVDDGDPNTAPVMAYSGEGFRRPGGVILARNG